LENLELENCDLEELTSPEKEQVRKRGLPPLSVELAFSRSAGQRSTQPALPRLYTQPVTRNFATQPARDETGGSQSQVQTISAASPPTSIPAQQQPSFDIGRLTDEVYRHIQRKIRVERERRGL